MKRIINNIIILTILDSRVRKNNKNLKTVLIKIKYNYSIKTYSTKITMTQKEYTDFLNQKIENIDTHKLVTINNLFDNIVQITEDLYRNDNFSFDILDKIIGRGKYNNTLQYLILTKIKKLEENKQIKTAITYKDLLSSINRFFKNKEIEIKMINKTILLDYIDFLKSIKNSSTTIGIRLRSLSHIFENAKNALLLKTNPLKEIKFIKGEKRNMDISDESLTKLLNIKQEDLISDQFYWLQFWRCIYYGNGINMYDLLHLTKENIINNEIKFNRHKTSKKKITSIFISLTDNFLKAFNILIDKSSKKYLIPLLNDYEQDTIAETKRINQIVKTINKKLKQICIAHNIDKVTTYSARHCFATQLLRKGVPIEYISNALGHASIKTTQNYFDGYTSNIRKEYSNLL